VLKRVSVLGMVQGWIARMAALTGHYGRPAAGADVVLDSVVQTPLQSSTQNKPPDEEILNPQGINVIKRRNADFVIWGGRSAFESATWKYYTHRFQLSHYEHTFADQYDVVLFLLNTPSLWSQLKAQMAQYFAGEFARGAIVGEDSADAAQIKIDAGNNTPATIAAGQLHAEVLLRFPDFVEQMIITFGKVGIFESVAA
jgi:phage tail sheath protein FI